MRSWLTFARDHQVIRFLAIGGGAALANWLLRFPLSLVLPTGPAVLASYLIVMVFSFQLYRRYVFPGTERPLHQQIVAFILINMVGATVVLTSTLALAGLLPPLPFGAELPSAHAVAIGLGALINYLGHKLITFKLPPRLP